MFNKTLFILTVVLMLGININTQAQPTAYAFNGAFFSYGTINLNTAAFTTMNFNPQGNSRYPVAADNVTEDDQYAIVADFSFPINYFVWHINFTTLSGDSIAPLGALAAGQTQVKAFARDNSTDTWYMISGDDFQTSAVLYTVNINTGATTVVGNIQNATYPIAMAIDCDGNAYVVSVEGMFPTTAVLFSLNLGTAVATQVGTNLGFNQVFGGGQDMDFDASTGNLYWSAYWSDGFFAEGGSFRSIDIVAGTSTEIGVFGQFENITGMSVKDACPLPTQPTAYAFNGGFFSYGTIDLTTAAFTSLNFNPQGTSRYPVAADNVTENDQYAIVSDFSFPQNYFVWHINFTTLSGDSIAPLGALASGQTQVKAFARDNSTDTWYMISGDDFQTSAVLYTVNINTGATTVVGNITNATYPIAMAIDCEGNAFVVSVEGMFPTTAVLFSLNLSTAVATQVGTNLGFNQVFGGGQDMDFDPSNGNLYWSAYWSDGFFSEGGSFRIIDEVAGTSTEIWVFGQFENITGMSVKDACTIVPVELTSFTASVKDGIVKLDWSTATEVNNSGFEIERKNNAMDWQKVGFAPGFGTSTEPRNYSFIDNSLLNGSYSYRLKQIDFDGSYEYSDQVNITVSVPVEFKLAQNYPNPFNPSTTIEFSIPNSELVNVIVYNALGQKVAELVNTILPAGQHKIIFDAKGLASGIYIVKMKAGNFTETRKINLLK